MKGYVCPMNHTALNTPESPFSRILLRPNSLPWYLTNFPARYITLSNWVYRSLLPTALLQLQRASRHYQNRHCPRIGVICVEVGAHSILRVAAIIYTPLFETKLLNKIRSSNISHRMNIGLVNSFLSSPLSLTYPQLYIKSARYYHSLLGLKETISGLVRVVVPNVGLRGEFLYG